MNVVYAVCMKAMPLWLVMLCSLVVMYCYGPLSVTIFGGLAYLAGEKSQQTNTFIVFNPAKMTTHFFASTNAF